MRTTSALAPSEAAGPARRPAPPPVPLAILSAAAGAIHLAYAAEHFPLGRLHGAFFVVVGLAQIAWGGLVLRWPTRRLFALGAAGNALVVATWAVSRTFGVPVGPAPWTPEAAGFPDVVATALEAIIVAGCVRRVRQRNVSGPPRPWALAALAIVAGGLAAWAIAAGDSHEHAGARGHHHSGSPIDPNDPLLVELEAAVDRGGATAGLDLLEERSSKDASVRGLSHQYVHALGRHVYATSSDPPTAFASCDDRFEGGCYHGVLQGYFEDHPDFTGDDVARLCSSLAASGVDLRWQCLHGLGHGLTLFLGHEVEGALRYCDELGSDFDRRSCYGGVFMELVIWRQNGGELPRDVALHARDPQYPCNAVDDRYATDCWLMQSSTILHLTGWDVEAAFDECVRAPAEQVGTCHESMGRDLAGHALHEVEQTRELCGLADERWVGRCLVGASKQFVDWHAGAEPAFDLCATAPDAMARMCVSGVIEMIRFYWASDAARARAECGSADPAWVEECERSVAA